MIAFDWTHLVIGLAAGAAISSLYFGGLAYGMRYALRTSAPLRVLSLSAVARMAILLGMGWVVTSQYGPWAFVGYGVAFFVARFIATTVARVGTPTEPAS
tara:strand:+ start:10101 stop:10400 length:300 start_codon:yes stop_codon:yes gene_type:complete